MDGYFLLCPNCGNVLLKDCKVGDPVMCYDDKLDSFSNGCGCGFEVSCNDILCTVQSNVDYSRFCDVIGMISERVTE